MGNRELRQRKYSEHLTWKSERRLGGRKGDMQQNSTVGYPRRAGRGTLEAGLRDGIIGEAGDSEPLDFRHKTARCRGKKQVQVDGDRCRWGLMEPDGVNGSGDIRKQSAKGRGRPV